MGWIQKIYHLYLISDRLCVIVDHLSHNRQSTSEKFRRLRYIPYVFTPFVEMNCELLTPKGMSFGDTNTSSLAEIR